MLQYIYRKLANLSVGRTPRTFNLVEADNGKDVKAAAGDFVIITLPLKASNGFFWQDSGSTAGSLEEVKHAGDDGRPGATTMVSFKFEIHRSGDLTLSYARPWDEGTPPAKWFEVNVKL